jgi:hypothetical protein
MDEDSSVSYLIIDLLNVHFTFIHTNLIKNYKIHSQQNPHKIQMSAVSVDFPNLG